MNYATALALVVSLVGTTAHAPADAKEGPGLYPTTYVPSIGEIWPLPQSVIKGGSTYTLDPNNLQFVATDNDCPMLQRAMARALAVLQAGIDTEQSEPMESVEAVATLTTVNVSLMQPCEDLPYLYMNETYKIQLNGAADAGSAVITSDSVWGAMLALESFTQLLVPDGGGLYNVTEVTVDDYPRFPFRGFMIDTGRHYLPPSAVKEMLEVMSMNKFNVLHWHIVDDQSFPYQSTFNPQLSEEGAWTPAHIFTPAQMAEVIEFATDRGIRVMPEFDTPGHTLSWGFGQPGLLTPCYSDGQPNGNYGPVDPTQEANYQFLKELFTEVMKLFPDHFLHLGGDEVPFGCWESNPDVMAFINDNNLVDARGLENYYFSKLLPIVSGLPTNNGYIVWEEVFNNNVALANDTIVHIWKSEDNPTEFNKEIERVTAAGYQALLSSCWYLNYISYGEDWHKYYECDPQGFNGTAEQKKLMIGGEACVWGEFIDRTNIITISWPRGSVVAERLWSDAEQTSNTDLAGPRLEEQRRRMYNRGHMAAPLNPSYCMADLD